MMSGKIFCVKLRIFAVSIQSNRFVVCGFRLSFRQNVSVGCELLYLLVVFFQNGDKFFVIHFHRRFQRYGARFAYAERESESRKSESLNDFAVGMSLFELFESSLNGICSVRIYFNLKSALVRGCGYNLIYFLFEFFGLFIGSRGNRGVDHFVVFIEISLLHREIYNLCDGVFNRFALDTALVIQKNESVFVGSANARNFSVASDDKFYGGVDIHAYICAFIVVFAACGKRSHTTERKHAGDNCR